MVNWKRGLQEEDALRINRHEINRLPTYAPLMKPVCSHAMTLSPIFQLEPPRSTGDSNDQDDGRRPRYDL